MTYDTRAGFDAEFRTYLIDALYAVPAPERLGSHWVMNAEWLTELRGLLGPDGRPLWEPSASLSGPDILLGLPIEVREDGGAPHLEGKT